jgi:hypothetical protein
MTEESDDTAQVALTIARLASMSGIEYDRCRQAEADLLGIRVATLDKEVDAARGDSAGGAVAGQGQLLDLPIPEPWPTPVNGAQLLDETAAIIAQYVVMNEAERDAAVAALWAVHTHAIEATPISPRLAVESEWMCLAGLSLAPWPASDLRGQLYSAPSKPQLRR